MQNTCWLALVFAFHMPAYLSAFVGRTVTRAKSFLFKHILVSILSPKGSFALRGMAMALVDKTPQYCVLTYSKIKITKYHANTQVC